MKIDLMLFPFPIFLICSVLTLSLLSSCTTTPGSGPQGSTPTDANASVNHGSSSSVNERNSPKTILPVNDEPTESNTLDSSVGEPGLASDAKKNADEGKGSEKLDDEKPNGGKQPGPSSDQPSVSVSPVSEKEDKVDSAIPPKNADERAGDVTGLPSEEAEAPGRKDEKLDAGGVADGKTVAPEIDSPGQPTLPGVPGTPSGLPGNPKDDELQNADVTIQGTPSGIPLENVSPPSGKTERKEDSITEPGDGDASVVARPSAEIDLPGPSVGTDGKAGNEPGEGPETRLPIDPGENEGDPKSPNHASGPGVELPNFPVSPTGERVDPKKLIELGDGEKLVPKETFRSGRYVIFGDDSTEPDETGRDAREIELSAEDFRNISVPGNLVREPEPTGKRIVFGNEEYVAPQRLPKRNTQFKSPRRDSVLILRRPDSGSENDWARGGAEKSDERQFDRLKELFEKRSANSDNETFSDSEKREFDKIRKIIESKGEHKPVDEDGKALPNRYLNALKWLRSKGRGSSAKQEDKVED